MAPSSNASLSFDAMTIINDTKDRGAVNADWYLTSIQTGFEPWQGGAGRGLRLLLERQHRPRHRPPPSPTPTPTSTTPPPPAAGSCTAKYMPTSVWNNGLTAELVITNTGSSTVNGWTLAYDLPTGQQVTIS
ncbi:cellulose binding domain-containing protein [Micromonospora lupini]|uniref:cellulose binding domain-containing protein n=1 Tax=Micromonospora lupini TaxID=285679 RepID=UPI00361B41E1